MAAATRAFSLGSPWRSMDGAGRRDLLLQLASLIERDVDYLAELESLDNGKPLGKNGQIYGSMSDLDFVLRHYRYFAGWADKLQGESIPIDDANLCYTVREPVGVCAAIIPWNIPLAMFAWKTAAALAAGCTMVLKTSEKTPLSALHMAKLVKEAGFPPGVLNVISGFGATTGQALARHDGIDHITFTGHMATGHLIQQYAAESNLKRVTLELGGKSPMIILDDADLQTAVTTAHFALFINQGQVCSSASRIFVQEGIYDAFVQGTIGMAQSIKLGAYDEPGVFHGPLVDEIHLNKVLGYIEKGKAEGATCACGGGRHGDKGYFVQPTVFTDVKDDMTIAKEEIFGPVMQILKFSTDEEVVERANNTVYGLAAGVFSQNAGRAIGIANQLRAGMVGINTYNKFDPAAPFGGYKQSGYGRDCGRASLESWLQTKTVIIAVKAPAKQE